MKVSEITDCENCPLLKEEICPGGMTSSSDGTPVEPPCCGFNDDTDLDQLIDDYHAIEAVY